MQVTAKQRALIIARVCERLATGQSLKDACAAEVKGATALKTSTFMLWMRRYGRAGGASADGKRVEQGERSPVRKVVPFYGMRSSKCAVLGGSGDGGGSEGDSGAGEGGGGEGEGGGGDGGGGG